MRPNFKHRMVALVLALMITASPVWGAAHATEEAISNHPDKPIAESYMENESVYGKYTAAVAEIDLLNAAEEKNTQTVRDAKEVEIAIIADAEIPMIGVTEDGSGWALLNLIIAILTGIVSLVLIAGYLCMDESEEGNVEEWADSKSFIRLMSLIPAVGAVIFFALTENMNNPIVLTDRWTILMVAILMIQKGALLIVKKSENNNEYIETLEAVNA